MAAGCSHISGDSLALRVDEKVSLIKKGMRESPVEEHRPDPHVQDGGGWPTFLGSTSSWRV